MPRPYGTIDSMTSQENPDLTDDEVAELRQRLTGLAARIEADRRRINDEYLAYLRGHLSRAEDDATRAEIQAVIDEVVSRTSAPDDEQESPTQ